MNEQNKNEGAKELVPIQDDLDIFKKFDELDDQLVIDAIQKKVVDVWVYHFIQDKHEIWGLAKEGVDQCAIAMGKKGTALREDDVTFQVDPLSPEHVIFIAKVSKVLVDAQGNEAKVETTIGTKRQGIMRKIKQPDGYRMVTNPFWAEQGAMKALRNAKMRLIPEDIKSKVIANAKKLKKVRTFEGETQVKEKKEKPKPNPVEKKNEPMPESQNNSPRFPDDEPKVEQVQLRAASQFQRNKCTSLMQTMVDKYGFAPDEVLAKMDKKAGSHDISTYSDIQAEKVIEYFEWVFKKMDSRNQ